MPHEHKLTQEQERQVALEYLCGVNIDTISTRHKVSEATIRTNIVAKRSTHWNDPLVELYRQADTIDRGRNSAHIYLTFQLPDLKIKPTGLIEGLRDRPVFQAADETIYQPAIEEILTTLALRQYLTDSKDPYDAFLDSVFEPSDRPKMLVEPVFTEALHDKYVLGSRLSLKEVVEKARLQIIQKVRKGSLGYSELRKREINEILETLTHREKRIIGMKFGLDGYDRSSTKVQIAHSLGITRNTVSTIEARAYRKLRHHTRYKRLKFVSGLITDSDIEACYAKVEAEAEAARWKEKLRPVIKEEVLHEMVRGDPNLQQRLREIEEEHRDLETERIQNLRGKNVEELELSLRTSNVLREARITTVGQLADKTDSDLLKYRNFGRKSLREVRDILNEMGLYPETH